MRPNTLTGQHEGNNLPQASTVFPVRMAWRETRAGWRHFLGLLVCVALGVGALVGVGLAW